MTPVISAVVMAHPSRLADARALCDRHPDLNLDIVLDPSPDERGGTLRTAAAAWSRARDGSTHHLVVQDDAILVDDIAARLMVAATARPRDTLSFFTEWASHTAAALRVAALVRAGWVDVADGYVPSVAMMMPVELARGFGAFAAAALRRGASADDVALRRYLALEGVEALVSLPNLAQHRELPSVAGNTDSGVRESACFVAEPVPAAPAVVARPPLVPYLSHRSGRARYKTRDGGSGWRSAPGTALLDRCGVRPDVVEDLLTDLTGSCRTSVARELALAALLVGYVAMRTGPVDPTVLDGDPVARAAIASLPGSLRRLVPVGAVRELVARCRPLAFASVLTGIGLARDGRGFR